MFEVKVLILCITMCVTGTSENKTDSYLENRHKILSQESRLRVGGKLTLTPKESQVNKILLEEKKQELLSGYQNSSTFLPLRNFLEAKNSIENSPVFKIIREASKGASLHTHLLAAASVDFLINNFTYRDNLFGGYINGNFKLKFLRSPEQDNRTNWTEIRILREINSEEKINEFLKREFSLIVDNPEDVYSSSEQIWSKFKRTFTAVYDMLSFKPVFEDYIYQILLELYQDNVMYTELKGTIMPLYELDGKIYNSTEYFQIFQEAVKKFKTDYPEFEGVRFIHSIYRGITLENLQNNIEEIIEMKKLFPEFIVGIDFVGYEEEGHFLADYQDVFLNLKNSGLKFFFHAGETNWFGLTDLNLVDAILLSSSRIGHGFALPKHPVLLNMVKERNIALEISPISNQVLLLNKDPRNHPATYFIALGHPVVVCNDDPSVWGATGLSYDWYVTFMAMTSRIDGLEFLKQLALNSISHSALEDDGKKRLLAQFERQWDSFLDKILLSYEK